MPRQGRMLRDRLSRALDWSLTSIFETVFGRRSSTTTSYHLLPPTAMRKSEDSSLSRSLQAYLDSAMPAEAPTEDYLIQENKYPAIRALRSDVELGDGIWRCCNCCHENISTHYKGTFPFKYLCCDRCDRCDRIIRSNCHSSEILSPFPYGMIRAPKPAPNREVRYAHICTRCGLSHRAVMEGSTLDFYGVTCAGCGNASYGDWPRYYIGNNEPYRRDPDASFVKLVDARADDAVRIAFRRTVTHGKRASSRLSWRNRR